MIDPIELDKEEQMVYLQAELLRALCAMRELEPNNYLVRLFSDALNGKLKPAPLTEQHQRPLPFNIR